MKYDLNWIQNQIHSGVSLKYIFFWGHQASEDGSISASCFSQWWIAPFIVEEVTYRTAEHWMMACKARLFGDSEIEAAILKSDSPAEVKALGRKIRNFDESVWHEHRFEIVVKGNLHKFSQHNDLRSFLLNTGERVIVEASPVDAIWGIGLQADHANAGHPGLWRGLNLLGFALMEVRDILRTV